MGAQNKGHGGKRSFGEEEIVDESVDGDGVRAGVGILIFVPYASYSAAGRGGLQASVMLIWCRCWRTDSGCESRIDVEVTLDGRVLLSGGALVFHVLAILMNDSLLNDRSVDFALLGSRLAGISVSSSATTCVGLSVIEVTGALWSHASLQELTTLHDCAQLKVLVLGVNADAHNAYGIPGLRHLLLFRVPLLLGSSLILVVFVDDNRLILVFGRQLHLLSLLAQSLVVSLLGLLLSFSSPFGLGLGKPFLLHLLSLSPDLGVELLIETTLLGFPLRSTTLPLLEVLLVLLLRNFAIGDTLLPHLATLFLTAARSLLLILLLAELCNLVHVIPGLAVSKIICVANLRELLVLGSLGSFALDHLLN
ncbi:hypothetical protein HG530_003839 [Fusarium avenaceum]|nr:hypothetical protein HG530_003839 [Fusarium avenaceum]